MDDAPTPATTAARDPWGRTDLAKLALALALAVVIVTQHGRVLEAVPRVIDRVRAMGPLGGVAYVGAYVVAAAAFAPGSILSMAGGAIFGVAWGVVCVFCGASLGALAAFAIARWLARGFVAERLARSPRAAAIDRAVAAEGWRVAILLRLSPVVPFNALNYALGVSTISTRDYAIALLGMLPTIVMYVYAGHVGASLARSSVRSPWVLGAGLVATVAAAWLTARRARQALRARL